MSKAMRGGSSTLLRKAALRLGTSLVHEREDEVVEMVAKSVDPYAHSRPKIGDAARGSFLRVNTARSIWKRRLLPTVVGLGIVGLLSVSIVGSGGSVAGASASRSNPSGSSWTLGIDVDWIGQALLPPAEQSPAAELAQSQLVMAYVKSLGSNSVLISFPFATPSPSSNVLLDEPATPTVEQLRYAIQSAQAIGLRVSLRPYLDQTSLRKFGPQYWSGNIEPTNRGQWFSSFYRVLTPYLRLAQAMRVNEFIVGAELDSLSGDPHWAKLLGRVRGIYSGRISYSVNWGTYQQGKVGVPVHSVGLDAYAPQRLPANATVSQLTLGWIRWFDRAPLKLRELTTIDELGILATSGAYRIPFAWTLPGSYDPNVQTRWFTAACVAARESGIQGIYFWGMTSNQIPTAHAGRTDRNSFVGRPSQSAISSCFQDVY